ncbi:MAG: alpha/beta fold hydrolase [Clostridia bacterium]|nr:alpha/beta fold hydrolase [Clostridia bacterium]
MEKYFNINDAGASIRCKLYAADPKDVRALVLYGHGFGGNKDNRAAERLAERLIAKNRGAAVLTFDWPCHGDDVRKSLRLPDCDLYLGTILAWIGRTYPAAVPYACAVSFGGYLILKYVSEHGDPFRKIALRCPAVRLYDVLVSSVLTDEDLKKLEKGKPALIGFDRKVAVDRTYLESVREADLTARDFMPYADEILILHGTKDELVPFGDSKEFAENNVIDFEPVENADHRFQSPEKMDFAIAKICAYFGLK